MSINPDAGEGLPASPDRTAAEDAEAAEENAADALDYATWAVDQAQPAVLDAIDARTWADARAAASPPS